MIDKNQREEICVLEDQFHLNPLSGLKRLNKFWPASLDFVNGFLTQDTSVLF